ncbi:MAG: hypothetical protein K0R07_701 [Sedimentibacter sp.]|nr:hypothetical protein [Sedimentibacter sp.]
MNDNEGDLLEGVYMNKNNRSTGNGKLPSGLFIGIIFLLLSGIPILIPFIIIAAIVFLAFTKGAKSKYNPVDKFVNKNPERSNNVAEKGMDIKEIIVTDDESNMEGYKNKTDSQKRLEMLKSLYNNGFMERDEYEERRKKINSNI